VTLPGEDSAVDTSGRAGADDMAGFDSDRPDVCSAEGLGGVLGNERLTALAGGILLVLIVVEVVTTARLRTFMSAHVFVGMLLAGPLAVKLGSTGYRFLRYYTGAPAYVRKRAPRLPLRVLAVPLVAATLIVVGSGIGLLVVGPAPQPGLLLALHKVGTVLWLPLITIHVVTYLWRVPQLVVDDWRTRPAPPAPGRGLRLGGNVGALVAGAIAAILVLPDAAPWVSWVEVTWESSSFVIVGTVLAVLAVLAARPLRWR
jgi:hypothetical protein